MQGLFGLVEVFEVGRRQKLQQHHLVAFHPRHEIIVFELVQHVVLRLHVHSTSLVHVQQERHHLVTGRLIGWGQHPDTCGRQRRKLDDRDALGHQAVHHVREVFRHPHLPVVEKLHFDLLADLLFLQHNLSAGFETLDDGDRIVDGIQNQVLLARPAAFLFFLRTLQFSIVGSFARASAELLGEFVALLTIELHSGYDLELVPVAEPRVHVMIAQQRIGLFLNDETVYVRGMTLLRWLP
mmetsp:Transcript_659/g.1297  ORF Transcript_659/g.1297 Transcript_659/m.1297 type:complete len:239 (+) Transcript_659:1340-2056(+)